MERIYAILAETSEEERDRAKELIKDFWAEVAKLLNNLYIFQ